MKTITGGDTEVSDDFFSDRNVSEESSHALSTSDVSYTSAVQDTEATITLHYSGDREPTNCNIYNLNNVTETTACTCSSGHCSVGLTGLSGYYGSASAEFYLSNNSESSNTSTINLSIDFTCPSGYVRVSANTDHGINNDFCVMAYEAKDDGGANPISQANNTPWVSISANNAITKCQSLGAKYDLISNPEWMTIAREIEGISSNWSGASIGSGCISRGNHNGSTCGYNNAAIDFGTSRNSLASLALLSGEVIWDFSGNVYEWVQWTAGGSYENSPYSCTGSWVEFNGVSCSGIPLNDFSPSNNSYGSA